MRTSLRLCVPRARHAAAILLASVATACFGGVAPVSPPAKGGGGVFRVILPHDPTSLHPNNAADETTYLIAENLFSQLVRLDADLQLIPDLAEAWTMSGDGRRYTFTLAPGARWHDGAPVTSADVRWTFERIVADRGVAYDTMARIRHITTPDARTVQIELSEPWAPFVANLGTFGTAILPRHVYEARTAPARPVGSGPFAFREWVRGSRLVLDAHRQYFGRGPYLETVEYRVIADEREAAAALMSGDVDLFAIRPDRDVVDRLRASPAVQLTTSPTTARVYIGINLARPPFDDVRVRRALNMAIDRPLLVNRALLGLGAPAFGFYTPAVVWAYNGDASVPPYDPAAAAALLDEAGLRRGRGARLRARFVSPDLSPFLELAREAVRQFARIGVAAVLDVTTPAQLLQRELTERAFDLIIVGGTHGPDPDNLAQRFASGSGAAVLGYRNPEFDGIVRAAAREHDLPTRARAYFRAQEILARDLPIVPLAEGVRLTVRRRGATGLGELEARGLVSSHNYSLVRVAPVTASPPGAPR